VFIESSDGVEVAVHELGGRGPGLLISHATGFHGRAYAPLAQHLGDRFRVVAFDYRGHGDTRTPPEALDGSITGKKFDWEHYADDACVVAGRVRDGDDGAPIVGFGHSMGGAALLMAAHRDPSLFGALVLFEPIVFPADALLPPGSSNPMSEGARRRRATFPSYEAALENFAAKAPFDAFPRDALEAYVRYGFRAGEDGQIHLKCAPETEAGTFEGSGQHPTWDLLPEILVPTLVVAGEVEEFRPAMVAPRVAERLPHGRYEGHPEIDHFGPMTHPDWTADLISAFVADVAAA
jgi:pimeloyl-ACP methyl ester carboxylesterase